MLRGSRASNGVVAELRGSSHDRSNRSQPGPDPDRAGAPVSVHTAEVPLVAATYLALTVVAVVFAWAGGGLGRRAGLVIAAGYLACVAIVVAS